MKRILLLLILVNLTSCFNAERNCEDYRTGIYEFETYLNGELVTSRFVRSDSLEIETFQGNIDTSTVRWINDCEYILENINPQSMSEEKAIHIKILTTNPNGYTFEYGQVGETKKARGEVKKVGEN
ncbi:DNA topoisomerase IV [Gramella sp. BOM4]|nr:DNA topoisomerase IV [Christiangramia bathymodioli]